MTGAWIALTLACGSPRDTAAPPLTDMTNSDPVSLPAAPDLSIGPEAPVTTDDLVVSIEDPDPTLEHRFQWYQGETPQEDLTSETVPSHRTSKGETWRVVVTPSNDQGEGGPAEASITVLNTPPSIAGVTLDPTDVYEATTVQCLATGWRDDDGDTIDYGYAWFVNSVQVSTQPTLDGTSFDRDDAIACAMTPDDGLDEGETRTSETLTVNNSPPSITEVVLSTSSPTEGDTLSASITGAVDDDGDAITYSYAWSVDGFVVGTTDTFTGIDFDKGQSIAVVVTPFDGTHTGEPVYSDTATAINTPPQVVSVEFTVTEAFTDDRLVAAASIADPDPVDTVSLAYAWQVNGKPVAASGPQLDGVVHFDKDDLVTVTVTPWDGAEEGLPQTSDAMVIANTPPTAPVLEILPEDPLPGTEDLVCRIETPSVDADGDPVAYTFAWDLDGVAHAETTTTYETGDSIAKEAITTEGTWDCTVIADDGEEDGPVAVDSMYITDQVFRWTGPRPLNLWVISLDTTRRDRIGRFSGMGTTDFLDARLEEAVVLEDHRSCSNWTYPSTTCVQTGLFPANHGWWPGGYDAAFPAQPGNQDTLQSTLGIAGYLSGLVTSNDYISPRHPHGRAFDRVSMQSWLPANYVAQAGLPMAFELADSGQPWYLHTHFFDPHGEYDPPYPYDAGLDGLLPIPWDMSSYYGIFDAMAVWFSISEDQQDRILDHVEALYQGELQYWDAVLAQTWTTLDDAGLLDDTLVVFWTDHGEQFMERGYGFGHGYNLFAEENRSTAAFWAKNLEHRAVPLPTIHQDLTPTILDILEVEPVHTMDGIVLDDIAMDRTRRAFITWGGDSTELMVEKNARQINYFWWGGVQYHDNAVDPYNLTEAYDPTDPDVQEMLAETAQYIADVRERFPSVLAPVIPW